jgi:type II secretory pathway component PulM
MRKYQNNREERTKGLLMLAGIMVVLVLLFQLIKMAIDALTF